MTQILYKSTRRADDIVTASEAILNGLSSDGGLYVPEEIPPLSYPIETFAKMTYKEAAFAILKSFLTDYTDDDLIYCINGAYDEKFDTSEIAPFKEAAGAYFLELYHGPTLAFKDMALSILPYLMITAAKMQGVCQDIVILTATSGDTGKAALAGFADVSGTKIIVFYPKDGVSAIQKLQMVTQKGANTYVVGVDGNFDDCQTGVKKMFTNVRMNKELAEKGFIFSSANSINIGRLIPQVVYYVYACAKLFAQGVITAGEKVNIAVPTGNFGNILAAYYAKKMGAPIDKLICASNENRVLTDFFESGIYDKNREFILTSSPSMDILISSNLERLIYRLCGSDTKSCLKLMNDLADTGKYMITGSMKNELKDFVAGSAKEEEVFKTIRETFNSAGYLLDPHTAVAAYVTGQYKEITKDKKPVIIASTASPYKFARSVLTSVNPAYDKFSDFELVDEMERISRVKVPEAINKIRKAKICHKDTCAVSEMPMRVKKFLNI